ncbi:hypothetical protein CCACVL1_00511 [Corchorus capsularis]|uniref:Uncharacterized protein n=1 Tax=Corchorus capsularis TaxID=210143 RepID=A0A1R3KWH9_COCAP|nr:hypothetical protein CCACVL1_00511 [Corchorus capsularis]
MDKQVAEPARTAPKLLTKLHLSAFVVALAQQRLA